MLSASSRKTRAQGYITFVFGWLLVVENAREHTTVPIRCASQQLYRVLNRVKNGSAAVTLVQISEISFDGFRIASKISS